MTPDKIKNIGIFAHVDAGKTTLTEQLLYLCGSIRSAGSVDSGTAITDWLSIERERGLSVKCSQVSLEHNGCTVNIIDTPGHVDFSGEAERSLTVLDGAVLIISAVEGVQSYTENLWDAICHLKIPALIFINKIDRAGSDSKNLAENLNTLLGRRKFLLLSNPQNEQSRDCISPLCGNIEERLIEAAADYSDSIAEAYLSGASCDMNEVRKIIAQAVGNCSLVPVLCGSASLACGVSELADAITQYLPSADTKEENGLAGLIYKIEHDKSMGKIAHVRMYGGSLESRDTVKLQSKTERHIVGADITDEDTGEKISQIRKFNGKKYTDMGIVTSGDIAALCGLSKAKVGDWIGKYCGNEQFKLSNPYFSVKVTPNSPEELTALVTALRELADEDPLLNCKWEKTEREITISITGKIQLEVISALLAERYNLRATFSPPTVIYKETIKNASYGFEAYTMPKPCWAVVHFLFEPLPRGTGVLYDGGRVPNNQLFYKYQTHIRSSFFSAIDQGLYGWEVTDFKATLIGGEHHTIHTHPLDFFVATPMAVMNGFVNCGTVLLEPYIRMRITADADYLGRIISDITRMRGEFDDPVIDRTKMTVEARLPVAESLDYPIKLASMTGGKATYRFYFDGYSECPPDFEISTKRRGINPLDRSKWILAARGAIQEDIL